MEPNKTDPSTDPTEFLEDSGELKSTVDYRETIQDADYDDIIQGNYGVKMTDELQEAVQGVLDLDPDQIASEEAAETLQAALQAAEDAPEANLYDDVQRVMRTGDLDAEKYKDGAEVDIRIEFEDPEDSGSDYSDSLGPTDF
jgi:hypothetical protein